MCETRWPLAASKYKQLLRRPMAPDAHQKLVLPLDEKFYKLSDAEITFFKQQTGMDDSDELKAHMLSIQAEAYEVSLVLVSLVIV